MPAPNEPNRRHAPADVSGREPEEPHGGGARRSPLIVIEHEDMLDDLLRLCAAAGAEPEVAFGAPAQASWDTAPVVLIGDEAASAVGVAVSAGRMPRRDNVLLVGRDLDDPGVWRRAVDVGAAHVAFLPDGERWLVDRIADAAEGVGGQALTIGVVGGRGGAGASTLACALGFAAARAGHRTVLVDADPLGGGLDVLLGGENAAGLRWPDLADTRGRVHGGSLEASLPRLHGLAVLSWDRGDTVTIPPESIRSVLGAARRGGGVVVVDLPRRVDDATAEALSQIDVGLLVVPTELRALAAAKRIVGSLGLIVKDLRVVARSTSAGMGGTEAARMLRLPLAGELPPEPAPTDRWDSGRPPGAGADGPLARFCSAFLTRALVSAGSVAA